MSTIKPKIGICIDCTDNEEKIVIKNGKDLRCQYHNYRYKQSKKVKPEKSESEIFEEIWRERPHVSVVSGKRLDPYYGTEFYYDCFAHILAKGKYPKLRYLKENIMLLTPLEHKLIDSGSSSQRADYIKENPEADFEVFYEMQEKLKLQFRN